MCGLHRYGDRQVTVYAEQENMFSGPDSNGLSSVHRLIQVHTKECFKTSSNVEETMHHMKLMQHCTNACTVTKRME